LSFLKTGDSSKQHPGTEDDPAAAKEKQPDRLISLALPVFVPENQWSPLLA
jgi:hypothetical protein